MKFEKQFILFSVWLLLTTTTLSAANSAPATPPQSGTKTANAGDAKKTAPILTCNRDILNAHGLEGLATPQALTFESCGTIRRSCCTREDEVRIAENWLYGQERKRINKHYEADRKIYVNLWRQLSKVTAYAESLITKIPKALSNCKLLANSVLQFELDDVKGKALENLRRMSEFMKTAHSGYACSICNFDNHAFIDAQNKTLVVSKNFCREIVKRTLRPLSVLQDDIINVLNIITKLLTACTSEGRLLSHADFPSHLLFVENKARSFKLNQCMKFKNDATLWYDNCRDICNNFHPAKFTSYFAPHKLQITHFTKFVVKKMAELKKQEEKVTRNFGVLTVQMPTMAEVKTTAKSAEATKSIPKPNKAKVTTPTPAPAPAPATPAKLPGARKLKVNLTPDNKKSSTAVKKAKSKNIFKIVPNSAIDTAKWKIVYSKRGFDFLAEGESARITERTLKRLKTSMMLERMNVTASNVGQWIAGNTTYVVVNDTGINVETTSRLLNSAGLFSVFSFMLSALIIL
jgi:hypothetical protein